MNSQNFFNSFGKQAKSDQGGQGLLANFGNLAQSIPGGLAGGAAAGGLMALLVRGHYRDRPEMIAAHSSPVMVEVAEQAGLARRVARLKPMICIKG